MSSSYQDYLTRLLTLASPKAKPGVALNAESDLVNELGLASLDVMEMIEQIEDEYDISFPLNALPDIRTLADLARQLEKLGNEPV